MIRILRFRLRRFARGARRFACNLRGHQWTSVLLDTESGVPRSLLPRVGDTQTRIVAKQEVFAELYCSSCGTSMVTPVLEYRLAHHLQGLRAGHRRAA